MHFFFNFIFSTSACFVNPIRSAPSKTGLLDPLLVYTSAYYSRAPIFVHQVRRSHGQKSGHDGRGLPEAIGRRRGRPSQVGTQNRDENWSTTVYKLIGEGLQRDFVTVEGLGRDSGEGFC